VCVRKCAGMCVCAQRRTIVREWIRTSIKNDAQGSDFVTPNRICKSHVCVCECVLVCVCGVHLRADAFVCVSLFRYVCLCTKKNHRARTNQSRQCECVHAQGRNSDRQNRICRSQVCVCV